MTEKLREIRIEEMATYEDAIFVPPIDNRRHRYTKGASAAQVKRISLKRKRREAYKRIVRNSR